LITSQVDSERSDGGFRLMKNCPRLDEALNVDWPIDDPTPDTAGSASTISAARCCSSNMVSNEVSAGATVPP
jgi:hypothetical protein